MESIVKEIQPIAGHWNDCVVIMDRLPKSVSVASIETQ